MVKDKSFYISLFKIAVPVALQGFLSVSVNMLDSIMVGSLGEIELSGVAIANQIAVFMTVFINGICGGQTLMMSQYYGKGELDKVKLIYAVVLRIVLGVIAVVVAAFFIFPNNILRLFTDDVGMAAAGAQFLRIMCLSFIFAAVSQTLIAMLRSVEVVNISLVTTTISLAINLALNYVLIFGKFGFPQMGIQGAAVATVATRIAELSVILFYVIFKDKKLRLKFAELLQFDKRLFSDFLHFGMPIVIGDLQWGMVGVVKSAAIGRLGTVMVSANSIAENVFGMNYVLCLGLSSAACVIIGKSVGEGDYTKTRQYAGTIQVIYAITGVILGIGLMLTRNILPSFYNISEEARTLAATFTFICGFSIMGTAYHASCFVGINRGAGDSRFVFKVDMVCGWLIVVPATFISALVLRLPLPYVYFATRCDQFFKWIIAFFRLRGDKWIKNVTR